MGFQVVVMFIVSFMDDVTYTKDVAVCTLSTVTLMETGPSFHNTGLSEQKLKIVVSWDMTPCSLALNLVTKISDIFSA